MLVEEAIGPPAAELEPPHMRRSTEDRSDPSRRPADRVLDLGEGPREVGSAGETGQELAHEVRAPVVKARDLSGILHRVVGGVLAAHGVSRRGCPGSWSP